MLNLDDISAEEDIPMEEDDKIECILCTHTNHSYLDHMHHTLSCTTSKTNLYTILHDAFNKQMNLLKKQGLEYHTITKDMLVRHYEYHVISFERAVMEDVRLVKQMMQTLQRKILTHDGVNSIILKEWKMLSTHKLKLLSKVKRQKQPTNMKIEPYDFSS